MNMIYETIISILLYAKDEINRGKYDMSRLF